MNVEITSSGNVTTSGESIVFAASSAYMGGSRIGSSASVTSNTFNSLGPGVMVDARELFVDEVTVTFDPLNGRTGYVREPTARQARMQRQPSDLMGSPTPA